MDQRINRFLDYLSENLAHRKGLLPMLGIILVALSMVVQFIPGLNWLAETDLLLHLGVLVALIGMLLAWAL